MFTDAERARTIDYVIGMVTTKGIVTFDIGSFQRHELALPYGSFTVTASAQPGFQPLIEVSEHFGRRYLWSKAHPSFDGLRLLYRAGLSGLYEVALEGISMKPIEEDVFLPFSSAERLLRSRTLTGRAALTPVDIERFDSLLGYADRYIM